MHGDIVDIEQLKKGDKHNPVFHQTFIYNTMGIKHFLPTFLFSFFQQMLTSFFITQINKETTNSVLIEILYQYYDFYNYYIHKYL